MKTITTNDGTVIYFTAEKVERTALDEVVVTKGKFTACEEAVPKWSFTADQARIKTECRLRRGCQPVGADTSTNEPPADPVDGRPWPVDHRRRQRCPYRASQRTFPSFQAASSF